MEVKFKKTLDVPTPIYATDGAAAIDLYAGTKPEWDIKGQYYEYDTGIALSIPSGYGALLLPRSSISTRNLMFANTIGLGDPDFRGSLKVRVKSIDRDYHLYDKGERIAQLLIIPCPKITLTEVEELDSTDRGEGGFGSTGTKEQLKVGDEVKVTLDCEGVTEGKIYTVYTVPNANRLSILDDNNEELGLYKHEVKLVTDTKERQPKVGDKARVITTLGHHFKLDEEVAVVKMADEAGLYKLKSADKDLIQYLFREQFELL